MNKTASQSIPQIKQPTAIRSVTCYIASPVEMCDHCSAGIKYVSLVTFKDGTHQKFGCKCIERVLSGDVSLLTLFRKNEKLLRKYRSYQSILSLPAGEMQVDPSGYYNRGFFFIADENGKTIQFDGRAYFHPTNVDWEKFSACRAGGGFTATLDCRPFASAWEPFTAENWQRKCEHSIQAALLKLASEIERLEAFLARIVSKGLASYAIAA